jgi:hypothetical protein
MEAPPPKSRSGRVLSYSSSGWLVQTRAVIQLKSVVAEIHKCVNAFAVANPSNTATSQLLFSHFVIRSPQMPLAKFSREQAGDNI